MKQKVFVTIFLIITITNLVVASTITGDAISNEFSKFQINQKAEIVAKEIEDYLKSNPEKTIKELQEDQVFREIAVQIVEGSGYTAVLDSTTGTFYFHIQDQLVNTDSHALKDELPKWWTVMEPAINENCKESNGEYDWKEQDGTITKKYMSLKCIKQKTKDNKSLFVAATAYIDINKGKQVIEEYGLTDKFEVAKIAIKDKAESVAKQIDIYLYSNPEKTIKDLQEDAYFNQIAVQKVGETGYTAVTDYNSLICRFHTNPSIINLDLSQLSEKLPGFWDIMAKTRGGKESEGTYKWQESDGSFREKYMYIAITERKTAEGVGLSVAATTYLDEYATKTENTEPTSTYTDYDKKAEKIVENFQKLLDNSVEDTITLSKLDYSKKEEIKEEIKNFIDTKTKEIWYNIGTHESEVEQRKKIPMYKEFTFIDKNGKEIIKYSNGEFSNNLKDVSIITNTEYKSEKYFEETLNLEKGIVNVGNVMTWYSFKDDLFKDLPKEDYNNYDKLISRDTEKQGTIRFSTKAYDNEKFIGIVVLSLDYRALQELTKHINPSKDELEVSTSYNNDYILVFDKEGNTIIHPKPDNIRGYLENGQLAGYNREGETKQGNIFNLFLYDKSKSYNDIAESTIHKKEKYSSSAKDVSGRTKLTLSYPITYNNPNTNYKDIGVFGGIMMSVTLTSDIITGEISKEGKERIKEKAFDIGKQIELFLRAYPEMTLDDLKKSKEFQEIVVQKIGKTGYTFAYDCNTMINHFHKQEKFLGLNYTTLKDEPGREEWWAITEPTYNCKTDTGGTYLWEDTDGVLREKYKYTKIIGEKTADGITLALGVSTYPDEFAPEEPKEESKNVKANTNIILIYILISAVIIIFIIILVLKNLGIIQLQKNHISILMAITILLIGGLFLWNTNIITNNLRSVEKNHIGTIIESSLEAKTNHIETYLEQNIERFKLITSRNQLRNEIKAYSNDKDQVHIEKIEEIIIAARESVEEIERVCIIDINGNVIASSNKSFIGKNVLDKEFFISGLKKEGIYLVKEDGINKMFVSGPFILNGEVIATGITVVKINKLNEIMNEEISNQNNYITDINSIIITGKNTGEKDNSKNTQECIETHLINKKASHEGHYYYLTERYNNNNNQKVISGHSFIMDQEWCIIGEMIEENELTELNKEIGELWLFTIGLLISLIIIGVIFYSLLTRTLRSEINKKTKEIQKINKGLEKIVNQRTKELKELNKGLEKEVNQRTKELNNKIIDLGNNRKALLNIMEDIHKANDDLKKLDKAKSEFLNIVSHELKTPLTAMMAYIDILDDSGEHLTEEEKQSLSVIKRNANNLKMLIGNILEIARMDAGKFELTKEKIDLKEIIETSLEDIKILAEQKNLKLITKIGNVGRVNVDPERIKEIINNLVSNAIKFTEKGSITVDVTKKEENVKISVEDTGVGIPEEHLKDLFKAFYQVDASISRKYGGTGLGLAITKKIAEAHGGKIEVTSIKGKGTKFTITLPIK